MRVWVKARAAIRARVMLRMGVKVRAEQGRWCDNLWKEGDSVEGKLLLEVLSCSIRKQANLGHLKVYK